MISLNTISEKAVAAALALVLSVDTIQGTVHTPSQAPAHSAGAYVSVVA